ncbi:hypothetical protein [Nakamurella lactea]|jgi:hypothetical protein|uniref:hypothetical protein n=1 Tax=Nakamurella lactea TaxID=459515 RepID=UPI000403FFEC|nr:hypothetical protein [Nakamurella lactea]
MTVEHSGGTGTPEPATVRPAAGDPTDTAPTDGAQPEDLNKGPRRVLATLYGIFALAAVSRAGVQISTRFDDAPLAYSLSLLSGLVYVAATVGLTTTRSWSRPLAWTACAVELVGVLVIGTLSLLDKAAFPHDTVWSRFGSGYLFIPVILPLLGLGWLFATRHRGEVPTQVAES